MPANRKRLNWAECGDPAIHAMHAAAVMQRRHGFFAEALGSDYKTAPRTKPLQEGGIGDYTAGPTFEYVH
jgi:hypothetical protein